MFYLSFYNDSHSQWLSEIAFPGLTQEGLFRKAGHVDRQRLLYDRLNTSEAIAISDLGEFTVHDCANVLKTFLGELPEPLFVEKYLTAYRQVVGKSARAFHGF